MRTVKIETRPTYKLDKEGAAFTFGNVDAKNSQKQPIRIVQANVNLPENITELVEWFGGEDFVSRGIEFLAAPLLVRLMREPLVGESVLTLGQKGDAEREKLVEQMLNSVQNLTSIRHLLVDDSSENTTKINFADAAAKLDHTAPDFVEKFAELRRQYNLG